MKVAKNVLFKYVPLTVASIFATSAFAVEKNNCPTVDFIYSNFVNNSNPAFFVEESQNGGTQWKLIYKDVSYKYTSLYPDLKLVSVQAKMMSDLASEAYMKRIECTYRSLDQKGEPVATIPPIKMFIEGSAYLIMDTNGMVGNQARYVVKTGQVDTSSNWRLLPNPEQKDLEFNRDCPKPGRKIEDCTFKWHQKDQPNGYWQDAIYRCTVYAKCRTFRNRLSAIESRLQGINPKTLKTGCTELTCSDEIKEMNVIIQEMGEYLTSSYGGLPTDPWLTYWARDPDDFSKVSTNWQQYGKSARRTADLSEDDPELITVNGTLHWTFGGKENADKNTDESKMTQRALARYGKLTGHWPDYATLGLTMWTK